MLRPPIVTPPRSQYTCNDMYIIISVTTFPRQTVDTRRREKREKNVSTGGRLFVYIFIYYRHAPQNIRILLYTICILYTDTFYSVYLYYTLLILVHYRPVADTCVYNNIICYVDHHLHRPLIHRLSNILFPLVVYTHYNSMPP